MNFYGRDFLKLLDYSEEEIIYLIELAMEFKKKDHENHEQAWSDYLKLCKCGGSISYLETLKYANVSNPFEDGSVAKSISFAKEELLNSPLM